MVAPIRPTTPAAKSLSPSSTKEVDSVRAEVGQLKAELQKEQKTIEEMREEAKKKARREGMKAAKEGEGEGASSAEKVENGVVKKPAVDAGGKFEVSSAEAILAAL